MPIYKSILVKDKGEIIDISEKKIIVWPACEYAKKWVGKIQLKTISKVIDSSSMKTGKKISLMNEEYIIESIDILNLLEPQKFIILISSDKYKEEIYKYISENYQSWLGCTFRIENVLYSYDDLLYSLCFDYENAEKITTLNISSYLPYYIGKTRSLLKRICNVSQNDTLTWIPLSGERLTLKLSIQRSNSISGSDEYVIHYPMHTPLYINDRKVLKEIFLAKKQLGINRKLVVYEDEEGFQIDHYGGEYVDFTRVNMDCVIDKIREIHNSGVKIDIQRDRIKEISNYIERVFAHDVKNKLPIDIVTDLYNQSARILISENRVLSHGDLWPNNIIMFEGEVEIIDWMTMSMADPMFDVCKFFCRAFVDYDLKGYGIHDVLHRYYNRIPSVTEIEYAELMVRYIALDFYLKQLNKGLSISSKLIDLICSSNV